MLVTFLRTLAKKIQDRIDPGQYPKHRKQSRTRPAVLQKSGHGTLFGGPVPAHSGDEQKLLYGSVLWIPFSAHSGQPSTLRLPTRCTLFQYIGKLCSKKDYVCLVQSPYELNSCPTCWPSIQHAHRKDEWGTERRQVRTWIYALW